MTMKAYTLLWALLLHPQGSDLLPFAKSRTWSAQSESLLEWSRLRECNDIIRSPGSLWTILHQTSVPNGATWADLIAERTPEDLLDALQGRSATEGPGFVSWNVRCGRPTLGAKYLEATAHQKVARRWEDNPFTGNSLGSLCLRGMGESIPSYHHHRLRGRQRSRRCCHNHPSVSRNHSQTRHCPWIRCNG